MAMLMASAAITINACLRLTARINAMGRVKREVQFPMCNQSNLILAINGVLFHAK